MRIVYISLIATIGLLLIPVGVVFSFTRAFFMFRWNPLPKLRSYLNSMGVALSQLLNTTTAELFNEVLITSRGFKFGNVKETTSSVLGKNKAKGTLSHAGEFVVSVLNKVDPNHVEDASGFVQVTVKPLD